MTTLRHISQCSLLVLVTPLVASSLACGGDSDDGDTNSGPDAGPGLFEDRPECTGDPIDPGTGDHAMVLSRLEIASATEGIDLDGDGTIDNKFSVVGTLAGSSLEEQLDNYELIVPIEFFDFEGAVADECVKFGMYTGEYKVDTDTDGALTSEEGGDCNDTSDLIGPEIAEILGNGRDDDCDGLADEDGDTPSADTADADGDGVTIADGDCDDTLSEIQGPAAAEICGDGLDNDCDGVADFGVDGAGQPECSPYDLSPDTVVTDASSFDADGDPLISFDDGSVVSEGGKFVLNAGPSIFSLFFDINDEVTLELRITGATIVAEVIGTGAESTLEDGILTGVLDAHTIDKIRGLDVPEIMLTPEDSFLDAIFANFLGQLMSLPRLPEGEYAGCYTPDIDVDRDGLEAFCDSDPEDEVNAVDVCIDGDGTIILDTATEQCTDARDDNGNLRFRDGISIALGFDAVPVNL